MLNQQIGNYSVIAGRWPIDQNKPTIIFIHGAATCKELWQFQVQALADIANPIAIDLPGHGQTLGKACDRIDGYAQSVIDFLDIIRPEKTIVCGLSMGGAVSQQLLIQYPDKFCAGILMHTGAKLKVMPMIFETIKEDYRKYHKLMIDFAVAKETDKFKMTGLLKDIVSWEPEVALSDFFACDSFNVMDQLNRIHAPVLVVIGDEDNITPPKYGEFISKNIPDARLVMIKGTGHLSPIEKPEAVNQVIRDFISGASFTIRHTVGL